jgi:hypothetical protein
MENEESRNQSVRARLEGKNVMEKGKHGKIVKLSYEDILYRFLTEYCEYP